MDVARRFLLALVLGGLVAGCGAFPAPMFGGDLIVLQVANASARPVVMSVATPDPDRTVVGSVEPRIVAAGQTVVARFVVPSSGEWAIYAGDDQLIGAGDTKGKRGQLPMGIDIDANGNSSWWCQGDCP